MADGDCIVEHKAYWTVDDDDLSAARHVTAKRRAIRAALAADGIAAQIEAMVDALLSP